MGSHTETFNAHEAVCVYDKTQGIEVPFQGPESVTIDDITKDVTLNGQPVRKFEWDKAMGGTFWKFNIVGWQLLELTVPDVILDDGNGDKAHFKYRLGLSYKWKSGTKGGMPPFPGMPTLLRGYGVLHFVSRRLYRHRDSAQGPRRPRPHPPPHPGGPPRPQDAEGQGRRVE
mmetsp:Transcript_31921/g.93977  ORF Transcript_31921/g.93977 Transcript_31921/m.93977 type:complete len:172 (-) Transcript_31921:1150-1665(-)